ncbi:hypothetical protein [Microbacterium aurum]
MLYTILDQRLTVLARSEAIAGLPDVLRIPLSEPLFLLGVLFILVVMFLPGGIRHDRRMGAASSRRTHAVPAAAAHRGAGCRGPRDGRARQPAGVRG